MQCSILKHVIYVAFESKDWVHFPDKAQFSDYVWQDCIGHFPPQNHDVIFHREHTGKQTQVFSYVHAFEPSKAWRNLTKIEQWKLIIRLLDLFSRSYFSKGFHTHHDTMKILQD